MDDAIPEIKIYFFIYKLQNGDVLKICFWKWYWFATPSLNISKNYFSIYTQERVQHSRQEEITKKYSNQNLVKKG